MFLSNFFQRTKMSELKEVAVVFGSSTKYVRIDLKSFDKTVGIISNKFKLKTESEFKIKTVSGVKGDLFDVDDDEDLRRFKENDKFFVHLAAEDTEPQPVMTAPPPYMPYAQSLQPQSQAMPPQGPSTQTQDVLKEMKVTVEVKGRRKSVCIYPESVQRTRDSIRQRFGLQEEFRLLAKQPGVDECFDIEDEGDVDELQTAEVLIVPDDSRADTNVTSSVSAARQELEMVQLNEGEQHVLQKGVICKVQPDVTVQTVQREKGPLVEIEGFMYPFNKPPPPTSLVVKMEMRNLAANFDIQAIIRQIDIVAVCLRIVLYGVVSNRDLELQVVEMQAKIEDLCNVSSKAVNQFGMKATNIQSEMKFGVGCLMEGFGDMAMDHFKNIAKIGGEMKGAAESLKTALTELQGALNKVYGAVAKENTAHMERTKQTNESITTEVTDGRKELLERKETQARLDREAAEERAKTMTAGDDTSRVKAVLDQDKSTEEAVCLCGKDVCCIVCCDGSHLKCTHQKRRTFYYRYAKQKSDHRIKAEYALLDREKAIRLEALQERERLRMVEEEATKDLLAFTESLKKVDPSDNPEDVIENALRGSEKALKTLRSAVQTIVNFWDTLQLKSESVMNAGSGSIGKMADDGLDETERKRFFSSELFQRGAVEYLGKWVAMQMMCEAFTTAMKPIQRNLQCSISDTPSRQLSLKKIPDLVLSLDQKLAERQDAMRADDTCDAEEIQAIMAGVNTL